MSVQAVIEQKLAEVERLEGDAKSLRDGISQVWASIGVLEGSIEELVGQRDELNKSIVTTKGALEYVGMRLDALRKEIEGLRQGGDKRRDGKPFVPKEEARLVPASISDEDKAALERLVDGGAMEILGIEGAAAESGELPA